MAKDSSPFHQVELHPIGDIYTREGVLFGLRQPNGNVFINFNHSLSYSFLTKVARATGCEIVQVKGTWTFLPSKSPIVVTDTEDDTEDGQGQ